MKFMQWLHRWTGLILLVQLVLWTISGLYFALVDHHGMSGHQYHQHPPAEPLNLTQTAQLNPVWWQNFEDVRMIRSQQIEGILQVEVHHREGVSYLDGRSGEPWQTSQAFAQQIAQATYSGPGQVVRVQPVTHTRELHGWQGQGVRVDFDDDLNTRVYVDSVSGSVIDHRNTPWVVADWMFRLHFIDYTGGRNFNNLLIMVAAIATLWFALSGLILLVKLLGSGDMGFSLRQVPLRVKVGEHEQRLQGKAHKTVLQVLQQHDIAVESGCGGGGSCGFCRVKMAADTPVTATERELLSAVEVDAGYRLSCQHNVARVAEVEVPEIRARKYTLTLQASRFVTPMLRELRFRVQDGPVEFAAGQYMQFLIPAGTGQARPADIPDAFRAEWLPVQSSVFRHQAVRRSYSMAMVGNGRELTFTVRYQPQAEGAAAPGIGSTWLCNLQPGEQVIAEGPYGDFQRLPGAQRKLCFIGGGAGMAPLRALITEELASDSTRPMVFFYGARNRDELVYADEFYALAAQHKVEFFPVLSEPREACEWRGEQGFVHEQAFAYLADNDIAAFDFYVCGPPRMLAATLAMLEKIGVDPARIRFDDFGN